MIGAFDRYAEQRESQIRSELRDPSRFLWIDRLPEPAKTKAYNDARAGKVVLDSGKRTDVPKGLIHHWTGVAFIPGVKLNDTLRFVQDYNTLRTTVPMFSNPSWFRRTGNNYKIYLRFLRRKCSPLSSTPIIITYDYINAQYAASAGRTTRISEVDNAGTSSEKVLEPGAGMGFLYKLDFTGDLLSVTMARMCNARQSRFRETFHTDLGS